MKFGIDLCSTRANMFARVEHKNMGVKPMTQRVFLVENKDGSINLSKLKLPDGEYELTILDKGGVRVSTRNRVVKEGRTVKLYRRFEGSKKMQLAQTYTTPVDNLDAKVIEFIMSKCEDVRHAFFDYSPHRMSRILHGVVEKTIVYKDGRDIPVPGPKGGGSPKGGDKGNGGGPNDKPDVEYVKQPIHDFVDIIEFEEKYMIVKGFMQVGKTKFIISSAIWFMLNGKSSIIVLRNSNGDKDQLKNRVKEYNDELNAYLGPAFEGRFKVQALSDKNIKVYHLAAKPPTILVCLGNSPALKKINQKIENNPEVSKKFVTFIDEVDWVYSEDTQTKDELDIMRQHSFSTFGVSATILDETLRTDIDKDNVIILSTPDNYKSVVNFKMMHLPFECKPVNTVDGNPYNEDHNLMWYIDDFSLKKPHYVELYDEGDGDNSKCYHPVDTLIRVSMNHDPNKRLLSEIAEDFVKRGVSCPVMYFAGGAGAGTITLSLPIEKRPITLMNGSKSVIKNGLQLTDGTILPGTYHVFKDASPALVKEWLKNSGGGVDRFPRIMTLAGIMASRCQSFGASDFNICLREKTLAWHLTEVYMAFTPNMNDPELMQTAGRLCVVARDNIQPLFYSSEGMCRRLIKAFCAQEELIERGRKAQRFRSMKKIIESMPLNKHKVFKASLVTRNVDGYKLKLVSKADDRSAGGLSMENKYTTRGKDGKRLGAGKLDLDDTFADIMKESLRGHVEEVKHNNMDEILDFEREIMVIRENLSPTEKETYDMVIQYYRTSLYTTWVLRKTIGSYMQHDNVGTNEQVYSRLQKIVSKNKITTEIGKGLVFKKTDGRWWLKVNW